jgi:hypothetical protein
MSEPFNADRVHDTLSNLCADAETAWRQRQCLPAARFWKVALGLGGYEPVENEHLAGCPHCRRRNEEVNRAASHSGLRGDFAPRLLAADQPLKAGPKGLDAFPGPQRLTFAADPHLAVHVIREKGDVWIHVQHTKWAASTLVRLTVAAGGTGAPAWSAFALLHSADAAEIARLRLREPLLNDACPRPLTIQAVPASALTTEDALALREAFTRAAKDDPAPAAWQAWAKQALEGGKAPAAVRAVAEEVHCATLPPRPER